MDIAIEAGIWTVEDARRFVDFGFAPHCLRALVEPIEERTGPALVSAAAIVEVLRPTGLSLVVHGHEGTTWAVLRWAAAHGHGIRIGLEDTLTLEGGKTAKDNAELVAAAGRLSP
jgi:3-keto-5-aminohexanoate cleavage enzyme